MSSKVVAIIGSYRKGRTIDSAVDAILEGAKTKGAETSKIYLLDKHIEFCTNCRSCTQAEGTERGKCVQRDDMELILAEIDAADAIVLGASVNVFNVNALFRRFMERCVGYAYWPWKTQGGPVGRKKKATKKAALVTSAAMPSPVIRLATGAPRALKITAKMMGAKPVGMLCIGLSAVEQKQQLPAKTMARARKIGTGLV